jgi:sulfur transfer ThiS family protein
LSVRVQLPPILRNLMGGERWFEAEGSSIAAVLADLGRRHPTLALHFFDEQGAIRHNIVCVHEGTMVRSRDAAAHRIRPGDEIILTNALAGG